MKKEKRKSGISVVGDVPWGTHLCQFYKTKEDLLDILIPYFKTGLENNEFCMWVTSEPLNVEEAKTALGKVVKNLDDYIKKGQIEILDYRSWYVKSKKFDSDRVLKGWVEKEKYALQNGFDGLRLTGNTFWLVKNDWDDFKGYEETVNDVIDKHRMIAICSYSLEKCNASEIIDVVSNHQFAIIRRENKWNIIESSERKKAEGQLKNSEERYRNLIELAPDSIVTMDLKGYITSCNSAATRILGYSKDDLVGKHFSKIGFLHVKDIPKYLKVFVSILQGKGTGVYELTVNDKDGASHIVETHIGLIKENNKISGILAITRDITERKKAESALKESEEKFRTIFENNSSAIAIIERDSTISMVNRKYCEMSLYEEQDVIGKSWTKQIPPEDLERMKEYNRKRLINPKNAPSEYEFMFYRKDGEIRHCLVSVGILPTSQKIVTSFTDITDYKKAQQEIKSLARFPAENPNPVLRIKKDGKVVYSNKAGFELLDFWKTNIGEEVPERWRNIIRKMFSSKNLKAEEEEEELNDKIFSFVVSPVADEGYVNLYSRDITEHKRAEEALRDSEEKWRSLTENSPDYIMLLDLDGKILFINHTIPDLTKEEVYGKSVYNFIPEQFRKLVKECFERVRKSSQPDTYFTEYTSKDGSTNYFEAHVGSVLKAGKMVGFTVSSTDITERKQAEETLKQKEDYFRSLIENSADVITVLNSNGIVQYQSQNYRSIWGRDPVGEIGKDLYKDVHPDDVTTVNDEFKRLLKKPGSSTHLQVRAQHEDKSWRVLELDACNLLNHSSVRGIVVNFHDITKRKQAEDALKESEEKLRSIVENSSDQIFMLDKNGKFLSINKIAADISQKSPQEMIGRSIFEIFPENIAVQFSKNIKNVFDTGKSMFIEEKMVVQGCEFYNSTSLNPIKDDAGRVIALTGIVRDITERKKAEEEIKKERDFSKSIVDTAQTIVMVLDTEGKIVSFNPYLEELSGYKIDEVKGKDWFTTFLPECDYDRIRHLFKKSLRGIKTRGNINPIIVKDGREILIEWFDKTLKANDGKIIGLLAIGQDVTERKKTEEMFKKSEERYKRLFNSSPELILETDEEGNIFAMNSMMAKSLGVSGEKFIGKSIFDILPSEIAEQRTRIAKKALKKGKNQEMEDVWGGRHFHTIYVPIIYPDGKKTVQTIVKDITDQKKTEVTLKESEEKFRLLFDDAPVGIALVDKNGIIQEVNNNLLRLLSVRKEEFIGRNFVQLAPAFGLDVTENITDFKHRLDETPSKREITFINKKNSKTTITVQSSIIKSGEELIGVLYILEDITERKQAEETLAQQNEALSQLNHFSIELSMLSPENNLEAFIGKQIKEITGAEVAIFSHYNPANRTITLQHIEMDPGLLEKVVSLLGKQVTKIHSVVSDEMYREMTTEIIGKRRTLHEASFGAISRPVGAAIQALLKVDRFIGLAYIIEGELYGTSLLAMKKSQPDPPKQILENFIFLATVSLRRKQSEKALQQSEEKYRFLFDDVPVGIGMVDESGRVVDCNQYLAEIFGMTFEEFKAINVKSLYANPKDRERLLNLLNKEGKVIDWECTLKRKDGTAFFAILNTDVIEREGQKLNLTTLQDITEQKVAEEKIKSQYVQLKKLDGVKTDFLNTTSHELRTPVASIKGYIQMLLKQTLGEITEEQKKALEVLLRNTNRLDHLIQDILDISRLESGTMKFITEKTDATKMIKEIAETMQASADLKRIQIKIDIQEGIPDLLIDGERIKQVLLNIVDNAIKFSPDGSMIQIKAKKEKEDVLFEVQDFGRGIPKNKQKKIFERFYQVDSGIDRKFGGVGLGLTISKKIIDTHGGQIWVDSTLGKGSSFKFILPLESTKNSESDLQEIFMEWP